MSEIEKPPGDGYDWQPDYHFYKPSKWINDPNGLVYINGTYHLYFQMNPDDIVWGNMHWGHASSKDLTTWRHHQTALYAEPDGLGYIFSGGAVVDNNDTFGLGTKDEPAIIATFTHHSQNEVQCQSIAYSLDGGDSFTSYEANPVIANPGLKDFRDPKVIWDEQRGAWLKVVVAGQKVHFYRSANLKSWTKLSEFGEGKGAQQGVWECPDFFPMYCEQQKKRRWVLLISVNPGGPAGGSGMQYFVGDFDGDRFVPEHDEIRWLDYGPDCYAGITWDNMPDSMQTRTLIGWMSNWEYANDTPTKGWRGAMTLPRQVSLAETLVVQPAPLVCQSFKARSESLLNTSGTALPAACRLDIKVSGLTERASAMLCWRYSENDYVGAQVCMENREIVISRQFTAAPAGFNRSFRMPIPATLTDTLCLSVFTDKCSLEFFLMGGEGTATTLIFPTDAKAALTFASDNGCKAQLRISEFAKGDDA